MIARFAQLHWALRALCFASLGAGAGMGQPPTGSWPVTIGALTLLFLVAPQAGSARQATGWFWVFGAGYFAYVLRWIVEPFQVEAEIYGWMAPFALALMATGLALF